MNRIIYALLVMVGVMSCSKSYDITGTTDSQRIDGSKLYLKASDNGDYRNLDSCDVVHGQFQFKGAFDSIQIAYVCIDQDAIMPVVLEEGPIKVSINATQISCTGTSLNDTLNSFEKQIEAIGNQIADLEKQNNHLLYQSVTEGIENVEEHQQKLYADGMKLTKQLDDLYTKFVVDNFDNILGPYVFLQRALSETGGYYALTPWVEQILSKATEKFKNDPEIKEFITNAQRNKNIENGTEAPVQAPIDGHIPHTDAVATPVQLGSGK